MNRTTRRPGIMRYLILLVTLSPCHLVTLSSSEAAESDLAYAERALRKAGATTDDAGLLKFIRARTLNEEQRKGLADKVRALGASEYAERENASRELVTLGRIALPYLRPAIKDPDLEIARRARRCVERIQRSPDPALPALAALLVQARRPPGAVPVLLAYLPNVENEAGEDTWLDALRTVGWRAERAEPALLAALKDPRALYRAAAAHVLGRGEDAAVRRRVAPLLADPDARVRFESAAALARFGDKKAIAVLLSLLENGPFSLACHSEYLLRLLAGEQGPEASLDKDDSTVRHPCRTAWEAWWKKYGDRVELSRLKEEAPPRGRTDVCEDGDDGSRVGEWVGAGQTCWEIPHLEGAHDVRPLPNGRVLLVEHHVNRISERDRQGKIHWQHQTVDNPIGCQRLPGGNTLIVTYKAVYEINRANEVVFRHTDRRDFRDALRLPNGHLLYVTGDGTLVERDRTSEQRVQTIVPENYAEGAKYRARVEPLLNGRYLLALGGRNRVIEVDKAGKIRWEYNVRTPMSATRLRNGHTLIACYEDRCVIEVDRAGKEINKQLLQGHPFVARRH
jgi:hypothetical protein